MLENKVVQKILQFYQRHYKDRKNAIYFWGNKSLLFCGDPLQLPSFTQGVYETKWFKERFTILFLKENKRQEND